jgi:hypothetical protein
MSKSDYLNANDDAFAAQLLTFKTVIPGYSTLLGLTPAQITAQAADADYFNYCLACQKLVQGLGQQWTGWKNLCRTGGGGGVSGAPTDLALPTPVTPVQPGVEARFRALVKQIKAHPNYNTSIGEALGIEGSVQASADLSAITPVITLEIIGSQVQIGWTWQGHSKDLDCIRLEVDRGDGKGFILLAMDTTPGYTDTTPFPATPAHWRYRAIYCVDDAPVGQWSAVVEITVG